MSAVVQVTIIGDSTSLSKTLAKSESDLAAFAAKAKTVGASMESAGRTLTHGITVPVVALAAAATKMADDYQTALTKTMNLSGGFGMSQQQLSDKIMGVSKASGVAATDLATALYPVQSSLHNTAASMSVLDNAAKMSAIGMGDAATTADALTSVINVYGVKNMSAAKAADIFTSTVQNSKFQIADLATSIGRVLPVAANAGIGFQALGGDLAALSHSGLSADQSVTGLTALISNMIQATRGTGNASKELAALGLSAKGLIQDMQTHGAVAALDEIINKIKSTGTAAHYSEAQWQAFAQNMGMSVDDVKKKFQGLDLGALQKIFPNKKALLSVLGLTDATDQAAQEAGKNVADNFTGGLQKAFDAYQKSTAGKLHIALNDLKNDLIDLGDKLLPKVAAAVAELAKWWDNLSNSQKANIEHWALLAAEVGPTLLLFGKLVSTVGSLSKLLSASPWAAAAVVFGELYINSKNFRDAVNDVAGAVNSALGPIGGIKTALELVAGALVAIKLAELDQWITFTMVPALGKWATALYGVRDAELAAEFPLAAVAAVAGAAAVGSFKLVKGALDDWSGSAKDNQKQIDALTKSLKDSIAEVKQFQGPGNVAGDSLKYITTQAAALVQKLPGVKDKAVELAHILINDFKLSTEQAKQGLEDAGFGADDAQKAIEGINTNGAITAFNALGTAAVDAANNASRAAYLIQSLGITSNPIPTSGYTSGGQPADVSGIFGGSAGQTISANNAPLAGGGGGGGGGSSKTGKGSAAAAKAAAKKAADAAKIAAAEALAATNGKPLLDLESWLMGGLQNTGKDGPVTKAAKALAEDIKKNYTVKGGTVPQAAQDAQAALANLAQQASSFNTSFQSNLSKGADFVSVFKGTGAGAGDIKAYLGLQVSNLKRLGADLKILAGKGLPPSILQMLASAGVDGLDQAEALVAASPADLASIIGLGNQITGLSQTIANSTESAIFSPQTALAKSVLQGQTGTKKSKDKHGHTINVTVNNADAAKIAKTIAQTLQNTS